MKEKYAALFEPIGLKHGGRLENRFAMCPMVVFAADPATGQPTEEDIKYFERRSKFADLLITGAIRKISKDIRNNYLSLMMKQLMLTAN